MSNLFINAVKAMNDIRGTDKFILMMLADMADDETGVCWPSVSQLSQMTGYCRRQVQLSLKKLCGMGKIEIVGTKNNVRVYSLRGAQHAPRGARHAQPNEMQGCKPLRQGVQTITPRGANCSNPPITPYIAKPKRTQKNPNKKTSQKKIFARTEKNDDEDLGNSLNEQDPQWPQLQAPQPQQIEKPPPAKPSHGKPKKAKVTAKATQRTTAKRGTRLAKDWTLPPVWFDEAVTIMNKAGAIPTTSLPDRDFINGEADKFHDYWLSKSGVGATKCDWQATWRNWIRNGLNGFANRGFKNAFTSPKIPTDDRQSPLCSTFTDALARHNANRGGLAHDMAGTVDGDPPTEVGSQGTFGHSVFFPASSVRH